MKTARVAAIFLASVAAFSLLLSRSVRSRAHLLRRAPQVATDQTDYSPASTASISGSGFLPKERVRLQVTRTDPAPDTAADHEPWFVQAGWHGDFATSWHVCDCLGAVLELTAVGQRSGLTARAQFTDGPSPGETLEGWFNLAAQWGGTIQGSNSRYVEGDTIPLRFSASLTAGTTHTVLLKYDFSTGGDQHFFDGLSSYKATIQNADPTAGISGLGSPSRWTIPPDSSLPATAQIPADLRVLTSYNISALTPGSSYTLINNSVKAISVTFTVASGGEKKNVVIAYGGRLASETVWGVGNGASHFPGASTKAFASLDGNSDKNVSVNPSALAVDQTPPVITCPGDIVSSADPGKCSALVTYAVTATDNNPGVTVVCKIGTTVITSPHVFPVGTTTVTCTATDAVGNSSTCSFAVTVNDTEAPKLNCPAPITVSTGAGQCSASVSFDAAPTDNCSVASTVYKIGPTVITSPHVFPAGTTTVACTATDAAGNSSTCSFTVTVNDGEAPRLNCPAPITVSTDAGQCSASVSFDAAPTDNCGVASTVYKIGPTAITSPHVFPAGTTTVACTATDVAGNSSTCSFTVTVNDAEAPKPNCPAPIIVSTDAGQCSAAVSFAAAPTDNCGVASTVYKIGAAEISSPYVFPVGTNTVDVTVTDVHGNTARCSFVVRVLDPPNISWPQALPLTLVDGQPGSLQAAFDECILATDQSRWFKFKVRPGSKLIVTLTGLGADTGLPANYDLVLFKDIAQAFAELTSQQDLVHLSAEFASDAFSPAAFSSDAFSPAAFSPAAFSPAAFSPAAFSSAAFSPAGF